MGRMKIDKSKICINCGDVFQYPKGNKKKKYCSKECLKEYWQNNKIWSKNAMSNKHNYCLFCKEEIIGKNRLKKKFCNYKCTGSYRKVNREKYQHIYDKISLMHKNGDFNEKYKTSSKMMKENNPSKNPDTVKKQKESLKIFYKNNPEKALQRVKNWINAPKRGRGIEREPTKLEKKIIDLNIENIRYTGNYKFWVSFKNGKHKNPDFKIKNQRKVIEVGDIEYWHTIEEIEEVIKSYEEINFKCLYFTNRDIYNDWENTKKKIIEFVKE